MDDKPSLKEAWLHHVTCFKFWVPIHISGIAEYRALKFFLQRETISSLPKWMTNHPKGGVVLLTWPIFSAQLWT